MGFPFASYRAVAWYCWRYDVLLLAWLFSCLQMVLYMAVCWYALFFAVLAWIELDWFINRLIDWRIDPSLTDWLIDRSINRLIDWSLGCWLSGSSGSILRYRLLVLFYSLPCAHERWDPCQFLLALRGFVELISVMVRFRSSVLFRPAWRWLKNTPSGATGETHRKNSFAKPFDRFLIYWYHLFGHARQP